MIKTFAEITFRQGKGSEMKKFWFDASRAVRNFLNGILALTTVIALFAAPQMAEAQTAPAGPVRQTVDANGVDLFLGTLSLTGPALVLGSEGNTLTYFRWSKGSGWSDNLTGFLNLSGSTMTVSLGAISDRFSVSGSIYTSNEGNGSTLTSSTLILAELASGTMVIRDGADVFGSYVSLANASTSAMARWARSISSLSCVLSSVAMRASIDLL